MGWRSCLLVEDAGLGPFTSLFRGLEFPAEYSSDLLFAPGPEITVRNDREVDVVDDGLLSPEAPRELVPFIQVLRLLKKVFCDLLRELRVQVLLQWLIFPGSCLI